MAAVSAAFTSQAHAYQNTASKLIEAKKGLEEKLDIRDAIIKLRAAYTDAEDIIRSAANDNFDMEIPLSVVLVLINMLNIEEIQHEFELKHEIARTCRIFMDITLVGALRSEKDVTKPKTQKKMEEILKDELDNLPSENIATRYELACCFAATLILNTPGMYLKQFVINNIGDVIEAIATLSPGKLVNPLKEVLTDLFHLVNTSWHIKVFSMYWQSKTLFLSADFGKADEVMRFYTVNRKELASYKKTEEVAFCVLEMLAEAIERAGTKGNTPLQLELLQGRDSDTEPGVKDFITLGLDNLRGTHSSSWKIRYRAIGYLFHLSQVENAPNDVWTTAMRFIASKVPVKENEHIVALMKKSPTQLKQKSLKEGYLKDRVAFLSKESEPKVEKNIGEKEKEKKISLHKKKTDLKEKERILDNVPKAHKQAGGTVDLAAATAEKQAELEVVKLKEEIESTVYDIEWLQMQAAFSNLT